jgi:crossover junction endodeoxyribonuclease RuvC
MIGIDPGITGAIAYHEGDLSAVHDIPQGATAKGKSEIDRHGLLRILRDLPAGAVWLEAVSAMPGQGVSSSFRFGETLGIIKMAATATGRELRMVTPAVWKRHFGLIFPKGTPKPQIKKASLQMARDRFPWMADDLKRQKDDGRAEALLIALYGTEQAENIVCK